MKMFNSGKLYNIPFTLGGLILTFILSAIQLRYGTYMSPNSWAFWEWTTSIIKVNKYEYFGGQPGGPMPPGISIFLVPFQVIMGSSGKTIIFSISILRSLIFISWSLFFSFFIKRINLSIFEKNWFLGLTNLFFIFILISFAYTLEANLLQLLILPLIYYLGLKSFLAETPVKAFALLLILTVVLVFLYFIHYSSVIFVPGIAIAILLNSKLKLKERLLLSFSFGVLNTFLAISILKGYMINPAANDVNTISNLTSNPLKIITLIGGGKYSWIELLKQASYGFGNFFLPNSLPSVLFYLVFSVVLVLFIISIFVFLKKKAFYFKNDFYFFDLNMLFLLFQTAFAFLFLYFIHNTIHLYDKFDGARFFLFIIFSICPLFLIIFLKSTHKKMLSFAFFMFFLVMPFFRTAKYTYLGIIPQKEMHTFHKNILLPEYSLEENASNTVFISPPDYSWIDRNYTDKNDINK